MNTRQRTLDLLNETGMTFEGVEGIEKVKEELLEVKNELTGELGKTADAYATVMTLVETGLLDVTDEVKVMMLNSAVQGAILGATIKVIEEQLAVVGEFLGEEPEDVEKQLEGVVLSLLEKIIESRME